MGCNNYFDMTDQGDSFESWQGLRGPAGPQGTPGAPGSSVELKGPVATTGDLPASAPASELWQVGTQAPYNGYFFNGEAWVNLGPVAAGATFTPTVSSDGVISWTNDGGLPNPEPVDIKGPQGATGATGATGPQGETGPAGPGVPSGGKTRQVLKKLSVADYNTAWQDDDLYITGASVGDLVRISAVGGNGNPLVFGRISDPNKNVGIVQNTDTATQNISKGQYVIWHGALYTASAAIASGATLSSSNLTAVTDGGLNALDSSLATFTRPNLLDNWYFVGGGSQLGYGTFPINQRGQTSYSNSGYCIDRWRISSNSSLTVSSDCITFSSGQVTGYQDIRQWFSQDLPAGTYTLSLLAEITSIGGTVFFGVRDGGNIIKNNIHLSSGSGYRLFTLTFTLDSTVHGWSTSITTDNASSNYVTANIKAWKLENGDTQTLAHEENGVWVLNEVPDYETELLRCKTSAADPSDTYANGSVEFGSNIGIVQNTDTATQNISEGQYVIWKGALYTASAAIASGATLSSSNLTAVTGGGLNSVDFRMITRLYSDSDLDNIHGTGATGFYYIGANVPNSPIDYATMIVISRESDSGYATQLVLGGEAYFRQYVGSPPSWRSWKRLDNV